jgi:ATP-dependent Lhr-like helicase
MSSDPTPLERWFASRFAGPTPPQAEAWPRIREGKNVLIVSPTGTGKTFAAFHEILRTLAREHAEDRLKDGLQCLYLSPLRALGYDLARNLTGPLREAYGDPAPIRVGIRSGDTDDKERQRQIESPPHLLVTTPESLGLLLSQPRWIRQLLSIRWVIVDEVHSLAENKRGTHLALSLARLDDLRSTLGNLPPVQRIGLSATVAPVDDVAQFLSGTGRPYTIIQADTVKRIELKVYTPLQANPYPMAGFTGVRMMGALSKLVQKFRTTLVFTNTRSGAESATFWLKEKLPALANQIECHHGSLDRDARLEVEDRLKRGELRAVVCSTSLELGIDIGSIDLVVMLSTPKGVAKALQRTGRAGHRIDEFSRGLLMATNVHDLVECCATARLARRGHLDAIRIPEAPLDVLAQHLMSMGCLGEVVREEAYALVRRSYPYRNLSREDFDAVLEYLAGGGQSLRKQYADVFGRIVMMESSGRYEARAGASRRDFLMNIGTIATEGVVRVVLGGRPLGTVEEGFMRGIRAGDVFMLGGRALQLEKTTGMEAHVRRADGAIPTVPRWGANKMPLSNRVAREIASFRAELRQRIEALPFRETPSLIPWVAKRLECAEPNASVIFRIHAAQHHLSEIPTDDFLLVEEFIEPTQEAEEPSDASPANSGTAPKPDPQQELLLALAGPPKITAGLRGRLFEKPKGPGLKTRTDASAPPPPGLLQQDSVHYFFHTLLGRAANDTLARVVTVRLSRRIGGNAVVTADDYGFVLTVTLGQRLTASDLPALLDPEGFDDDLEHALRSSDLLQHSFRNAAQTGLMIYRNYFGEARALRKVQWSAEVIFNVLLKHEPDHVLLREARRDTWHTFLDRELALEYLKSRKARSLPIRLRAVPQVTPLSFAMYATRLKETLMVEDPRESLERLCHQWWQHMEAEVPGGDINSK